MTENEIGRIVIDRAMQLHMDLGPGLLESVYEALLARSLSDQGLDVQQQVAVPLQWQDVYFECAFKADLIVNEKVVIELKSVEAVNNAHKKQVLTYLKLTGKKLGFLLNFGEARLKDGIVRVINGTRE